jgi:hypothetical protein
MRRREIIALASAASISWPHSTRAQQVALPVIGFLGGTVAEGSQAYVDAFRDGLKDHVEGRTVAIAFRWTEGRHERSRSWSPN